MTWVRLDDGFASHPKIAALSDRELRVFLRALCYCARHRTRGRLLDGSMREISGLTKGVLARLVELRLVDETENGLEIHDFSEYNPRDPTGAERQQQFRIRNGASNGRVTEEVTDPVTALPRAGTRARSRPVPLEEAKASSRKPRKQDELFDLLEDELGKVTNDSERGRRNKALKSLRQSEATPDELRRRIRNHRRLWPDIAVTATSLATNWATLDQLPDSLLTPAERREERERRQLAHLATLEER